GYARSGLTRAVLRGGRYEDTVSPGDLAAVALQRLGSDRHSLVYAYCSELDLTGHVRGPDSAAWSLQLAQIDRLVGALVGRPPGGAGGGVGGGPAGGRRR